VPAILLDGCGTDGATRFKEGSYAVFGEVNWKVMPRVTVTGGLRYTYQKEVRRLHELRVWRP
jgi:iron complex outermembrane recepter protein